jgi:hypothetical protein
MISNGAELNQSAIAVCRSDFVRDLNIFKHEIGHNFGLPHAGRIIPPADIQVSF